MFFSRQSAKVTVSAAPVSERAAVPSASAGQELEVALDAAAGLVRAIGRHAFDLPGAPAQRTAELCEDWARHLLLRAQAPLAGVAEDEGSTPRRRWSELVRFVTGLRKEEHSHVERSLGALREAIWTFVQGVHRALAEDGASDVAMKATLERLSATAQSGSPEELRREALATASVLGATLEERRRRQLRQASELGARVSALSEQLEEAKREANMDPLTRMYNRRAFDEWLTRIAEVSSLGSQPACLVLVDVDHFKRINDAHGHPFGDRVLQTLADTFRTFRRRDDVVARHGGEEFAAILRDTNEREGCLLAERLRDAARRLGLVFEGSAVRFTVSLGVAAILPGESPAAWLARADAALYRAKRAGRDRVVAAGDAAEPAAAPVSLAGARH